MGLVAGTSMRHGPVQYLQGPASRNWGNIVLNRLSTLDSRSSCIPARSLPLPRLLGKMGLLYGMGILGAIHKLLHTLERDVVIWFRQTIAETETEAETGSKQSAPWSDSF